MTARKNYVAASVKAAEDDAGPGSFEAVLSTGVVDRDGEVVEPRAFEPLPDHITLDVDHGLSTQTTVASGRPYYDGDVLKVAGTFSSIARAQEVRTLVVEGHIRTLSVAFRTQERQVKDGVPHITKGELLNAAFVAIPANPQALVLSAKAGARNSAQDAERLQGIHDLTAELGASCETKRTEDVDAAEDSGKALFFRGKGVTIIGDPHAVAKALAGSYEELAEELGKAANALHPDAWVSLIGTYPDALVYRVYDDHGPVSYRVRYTRAEDGTLSFEAPEQVVIEESVVSLADAVGTSDDDTHDEAPDGQAAADDTAAAHDDPAAKRMRELARYRAVIDAMGL